MNNKSNLRPWALWMVQHKMTWFVRLVVYMMLPLYFLSHTMEVAEESIVEWSRDLEDFEEEVEDVLDMKTEQKK